MQLKTYQVNALKTLEDFFTAYRNPTGPQRSAAEAFRTVTKRPNAVYFDAPGMPGVPYVCLRIPTGGGKTILGAHAVGLINTGLLQEERSLVLWLAPTDQIVTDTSDKLRDRAHPYRQALEASVGGSPVEVMDLREALNLQRSTLDESTVVIVATIASLRVADVTGRRVYTNNGNLMSHFTELPAVAREALHGPADASGQPGPMVYSLANVLRLRRPVIIVDEAHNADTPLSFETLERFSPSCILEMTATPTTRQTATSTPSNVVYSVSASQLKAEDMIKMPVKLETHPNWQTIITNALNWRDKLEDDARIEETLTGEKLRPIILYQAQSDLKDQENITVESIRHELVEVRGIPAEQVKIATGTLKELKGVDLNDPACPVRHVITVAALREGWDCPQAYVLCSVAALRSQTAIEQLVGRVLRMPRATPKKTQTLNHAYVYAVSESLVSTLKKLGDGLTNNGFSQFEARQFLAPQPLPGMDTAPAPTIPDRVTLTDTVDVTSLPPAVQTKVQFDSTTGELTVTSGAVFSDQEAEDLLKQIPDMSDQIKVEHLIRQRQAAPSDRRLPFTVPLLAVTTPSGTPTLFDASVLIEAGWSLDTAEAALAPVEYEGANRPVQRGLVDVDRQGKIVQSADPLAVGQATLLNLADPNITTKADLARWVDQAFRHEDIDSQQSLRFIMRLLRHLTEVRGLKLEDLIYDRHRLRDAVKKKIITLQSESKRRAFAQLLPGLIVSPTDVFTYPADYPASSTYAGAYKFQKHYYPLPGELLDGTEECDAAIELDRLECVVYWVRNLSRRPHHSFWFQTSTDKAYPDFVALLQDGRVAAIEYKGGHILETPDTKEKADLGALWTAGSNGKALYVLLTKPTVPQLGNLLGC